jgi:FMN phosphatase YigB (HAD superfamily)
LEVNLDLNDTRPSGFQPEVILFDLDGTLRYNQPSSTQVFLEHAAQLGVVLDAGQRRQVIRWTHYYWAQSRELVQDVAAFPGSETEFWTNYAYRCLKIMGCEDGQALDLAPAMHAYMTNEHNPVNYVPPDVPATLAELKGCGYRLGVLSNRTKPIQEELAQLGLYEFFELTLVAAEVSAWKPDPLIFQRALERISASPATTLYVGDNYYADILGAAKAGLQPVLIDPDGLFPEAECPVIRTIGDLTGLIL